MTATAIKKEFERYLPLLSNKQQMLVLEMIRSLLHVDADEKRITRKQYNKELKEAVSRVEEGDFISHKEAGKKLSKW